MQFGAVGRKAGGFVFAIAVFLHRVLLSCALFPYLFRAGRKNEKYLKKTIAISARTWYNSHIAKICCTVNQFVKGCET